MSQESAIVIGTAEYRRQKKTIALKSADRMRHMYTIGKTGAGKSTLYQNMMWQDIQAGAGCCFVDPHGEAIDWLMSRIPPERLEDVILFDPSDDEWPMGLNLLEWHRPEEKDFLVAEAIHIFYKIFDPQETGVIGPQFEHWMRNAALTIMSDPEGGTLIDIPRLFTDRAFEQAKRRHVTDKVVQEFWEQQMAKTSHFHRSEMLNYFSSKFGRFATNRLMRNIIGQKTSSINLGSVISERKILLVNLSKGKIGEVNAHMLGLILMTKLLIAVLQRAYRDPSDRPPFYLYVDEFQTVTTDAFLSMLAEARKYNLAVHIANQYLGQLSEEMREAVIGNAATLCAFQVGSEDTTRLIPELDANRNRRVHQITPESLQYLERHHFYARMLLDGVTYPAIKLKSFPPVQYQTTIVPADVVNFSRLQYAAPRSVVESQMKQGMVYS